MFLGNSPVLIFPRKLPALVPAFALRALRSASQMLVCAGTRFAFCPSLRQGMREWRRVWGRKSARHSAMTLSMPLRELPPMGYAFAQFPAEIAPYSMLRIEHVTAPLSPRWP